MGGLEPGGYADLIEDAAQHIDARQFNPNYPAVFPRLVQKAIWFFCAEGGFALCNGKQIDDARPCPGTECPMAEGCERVPLKPPKPQGDPGGSRCVLTRIVDLYWRAWYYTVA